MNHKQIYDLIIGNANSENRIKNMGVYYERHHIIPRSIGGKDNKENLVLLTAKEHYVCHKLLLFIYVFKEPLVRAFHRMTHSNNGDHIKSSRDYAYSRELLSIILKARIPWNKGKHLSKEHKEKLGKVWSGRKHTKETKEQQRNAKLGEKNPNFGKISNRKGQTQPCTEEQRKNLSIAAKNVPKKECEYCGRSFAPQNYAKWHGIKCNLKNK